MDQNTIKATEGILVLAGDTTKKTKVIDYWATTAMRLHDESYLAFAGITP